MQQDIRDLQKELREAHKGLAEQKARLDEQMMRADAKISEVERMLGDLNRAARTTDAEFGVKLERLIREVQQLRGAAELADYRLGKLEPQVAGDVAAGQGPPSGGAVAAGGGETLPKDGPGLLAYGEKLAKEGKVQEARGVLRDVVRRWPKEKGVADVALYRLGESYYAEKQYAAAVQEYAQVIEEFRESDWVDDAYFRIGNCSLELGNLQDARIFFNEIVTHYKRSSLYKPTLGKLEEIERRFAREQKKATSGKRKRGR